MDWALIGKILAAHAGLAMFCGWRVSKWLLFAEASLLVAVLLWLLVACYGAGGPILILAAMVVLGGPVAAGLALALLGLGFGVAVRRLIGLPLSGGLTTVLKLR